jgi:hypothetical protein
MLTDAYYTVGTWKTNRGLKLSRDWRTPENNYIYIYSLWTDERQDLSSIRCGTNTTNQTARHIVLTGEGESSGGKQDPAAPSNDCHVRRHERLQRRASQLEEPK